MKFAMPSRRKDYQRHWAHINEASFVGGMRLLFWICRRFGRWPFRLVLHPVLLWYVVTKPAARAASMQYLQRVCVSGKTSGIRPGIVTVIRHFGSFAEGILDKLLLWGGLFPLESARITGQDCIVEAIESGRGGLLICSHLGNLELCRVLSKRRNSMKLTVLVHTRHAQAFNQMLATLDPQSQLNLLQVTEMSPATAMLLNERVARGEFVVIAGDRIPVAPNPRVAMAPFLGAPAPFPVGPYVLASVLQCPVFLIFSSQIGSAYEICFERFRDTIRLPRKDRDDALAALAVDYAARLERHCLRAPLQWFNFYDFWHLPSMDNSDASR